MENITFSSRYLAGFVEEKEIFSLQPAIEQDIRALHARTGKGNDFLGWLDLPSRITQPELDEIKHVAGEWRQELDILVVVGIGGSYLGTKFTIEALSHSFSHLLRLGRAPLVLFAGQNISEDYLTDLLEVLDHYSYGIVVISKSGTTTESAIAFRLLKNHLEKKEGRKAASQRIIAITDKSKGALKQLADLEGYKSYVIPDDIGGRYSILSPVGLVPVAMAGFDIDLLVKGAVSMEKRTRPDVPFKDNPAAMYAAARNALYRKGKNIELLVNYNPKLHYLAEWWKQLFGESEGKENKGIFPASVDYTTDLHSLGQYVQEGLRNLFETVISIKQPAKTLVIPDDKENLDKLNFLAGKRIDEVNHMAELGTLMAHMDGGVPTLRIEMEKVSEYTLGQLVYFFEKSCAISGYLLGVNPFDQPGVEAYKRNMFALLGKPGFEEEGKKLLERLK
jgi:glucose-6-phosphate isomerase